MIYLLLVLAAIGHVIFWAAIVNRLHGLGIERRWIDVATIGCAVAMGALPLAIACLVWQQGVTAFISSMGLASRTAWGYLSFS